MKNKTEWKEVELGEICEIKKGTSITKATLTEGNIPVMAGGQQPAYYHNIPNREGDTITISGSGAYAGFVAYFDVPIFASDCSTIQTEDKNLFMKYVYYFLKLKQQNIYDLQKGIAQPHIYPKQIQKIKIPLPFLSDGKPDLPAQKQIAAILEKAEKLKQKQKKVLEHYDEYLKSVFYEMFLKKGFEKVEINHGILKTENKIPEKDFPENYFEYVDIASIDNKTKRIVEIKKILGKDAPSRAKQLIKFNDVLVSTVRPNLNAVVLVQKELDSQICSTGFCILRADNINFVPEYLFFISLSGFFISSIMDKCKGASYPAVSNKDIVSLKIPLPPLPLQQKFANIVEKVERLKEKQKKNLEDSEELFNVLMQKAFKGELTE